MDDIDRAQQREEKERELAISAIQHRAVELPAYDETGARICVDCADRIPHARLIAYPRSVRCVCCQECVEQRQQHMAIK